MHPDLNPDDPDAMANFQKVTQAYNTLSDAKSRRLYDRGVLRKTFSVADREVRSHKVSFLVCFHN